MEIKSSKGVVGGSGGGEKAWIKDLKLAEMFQALYPGLYGLLDR